jgi:hypothetical protein
MDKIHNFPKGELFENHSCTYRFQCDCTTPGHAMDLSVESWGKEDDKKSYTILMYSIDSTLWQRFKRVLRLFFKGDDCWREFTVRDEDAQNISLIFDQTKKYNELP